MRRGFLRAATAVLSGVQAAVAVGAIFPREPKNRMQFCSALTYAAVTVAAEASEDSRAHLWLIKLPSEPKQEPQVHTLVLSANAEVIACTSGLLYVRQGRTLSTIDPSAELPNLVPSEVAAIPSDPKQIRGRLKAGCIFMLGDSRSSLVCTEAACRVAPGLREVVRALFLLAGAGERLLFVQSWAEVTVD